MPNNLIPKKEYINILKRVPICCTDIVLLHQCKVLLIKRRESPYKGQWWVQGGRILKNESLEDAAKRKVFEETNLKIKIIKKVGFYELFNDGTSFYKDKLHVLPVVFLAKPLSDIKSLKLDNAHSKFKWVSSIEKDLNPYIKQILKDSGVFN